MILTPVNKFVDKILSAVAVRYNCGSKPE